MTVRTRYADPARLDLATFYATIAERLAKQYDKATNPKTKSKLFDEGVNYRTVAIRLKDQNENL